MCKRLSADEACRSNTVWDDFHTVIHAFNFLVLVPVKPRTIKGRDTERAASHVSQPSEELSRVCDSLGPKPPGEERRSQAPNLRSKTRRKRNEAKVAGSTRR